MGMVEACWWTGTGVMREFIGIVPAESNLAFEHVLDRGDRP